MPLNDLETPGSREPSQACPSGLLLHLRLWGGLSLRAIHVLHILSQTADQLLFSRYVVFRLVPPGAVAHQSSVRGISQARKPE